MAELEMWYATEKQKIEEQYKDLKDTEEYYEALALLLEIYKEKKKKILEEMKQDEEDAAEDAASGSSGSSSSGSGSGLRNPFLDGQYIADMIKSNVSDMLQEIAFTAPQAPVQTPAANSQVSLNAELKFDMRDRDSTARWFEDDLWPLLKRKFELMGINIQKI